MKENTPLYCLYLFIIIDFAVLYVCYLRQNKNQRTNEHGGVCWREPFSFMFCQYTDKKYC